MWDHGFNNLRYTDEKFLLRAGVNLICPVRSSHALYDSGRGPYKAKYRLDPCLKCWITAPKYDLKFGNKGYLLNKEFTNYCSDVVAVSIRAPAFDLHWSSLIVPGMTLGDAGLPYSPRRWYCHGLWQCPVCSFSAIRHNDINVALNNVFEFPVPRSVPYPVQTYWPPAWYRSRTGAL